MATSQASEYSNSGYYNVPVVNHGAPSLSLVNHNRDNRDRSLCLTSGAREAAAWQCGDLLVAHGMPGYATMGRERSLTLVYNSAQAEPRPVVVARVDQGTFTAPDSVVAELRVNGVLRASAAYWWPSGQSVRQIALAYDASGQSTGVYPFTLTIRNVYGTSTYEAPVISDTLLIVNRAGSQFGYGWWLAGVERLILGQPNGSILWVGADGSAKLYRSIGSNRWLAPAGGFRDTLRYDSGTGRYTRSLRHGIQVRFDGAGRHIETVNRVGQTSTFVWTGSPGRLTSIHVPPAGEPGTTYTLAYDGAGKLDYIRDPANRTMQVTINSSRLTSITDPDGHGPSYTYDGQGRMTRRNSRRNIATSFTYGNGLRVTEVGWSIDHNTAAATEFEPWDEEGLAIGIGQELWSADTSVAHTRIYGPRLAIADDASFWVDRWGAPVKVVNPLGHATKIVRGGSGAPPALVTRVRYANARIVKIKWDARGNLIEMRDSTAHMGSGLPTAITQWTYDHPNTKDSPDRVIDPEGITTRYGYNSWGLTDSVIAPNGHVTEFDYVTTGSLKGLVRAVIEHDVPVYDSSTGTETMASTLTAFGYNALGNVTSDTSALGHVREFQRDSAQRVAQFADAGEHVTAFEYDALNRMRERIQHVENGQTLTTRFSYAIDVLDSIIDPRGVVRSYEYDWQNRLTRERDDYGRVERRGYDRGDLLKWVDARQGTVTIRYEYDAAGQVKKKVWPVRHVPADSVLYRYNLVGWLRTATTSDRRIDRIYWGNGLLRREIQSTNTGVNQARHVYRYDRAGRRTLFRMGSGANVDSIRYRYDPSSGELSTIAVRWRTGARDSVRFEWDPLGRRDTLRYSNDLRVGFAYDADGRMREMCSRHPGPGTALNTVVRRRSIDPDGLVGHIDIGGGGSGGGFSAYVATAEADDGDGGGGGGGGGGGDGGSGFCPTAGETLLQDYDMRHQLIEQFNGFTGLTTNYTYDGSGSMTSRVPDAGIGYTYIMEPGHNRLIKAQHGSDPGDFTEYIYDHNGARMEEVPWIDGVQQPSLPGRRKYYYDGLGRTVGSAEYVLQPDGWEWTRSQWCGYDPEGRLWDPCENGAPRLNYDGANVASTGHDAQDVGWTFVHGPGIDDPLLGMFTDDTNHRYVYWITDGRGRQYAVGRADGSDFSETTYYTVNGGKYAGGITAAHTFGAERFPNPEQKGLSFFRNRFYDQATGRWTQEDPIGVAGGINLYEYSDNNPVSFSDPFGLCPEPEDKDGTVCVALFIQSESVGPLKGDGRGFSSSSDPSLSRVFLHIDVENQTFSAHVNPTCNTAGRCAAPRSDNEISVAFGDGGSFTVSVGASNSLIPSPAINAAFTFTPDGRGGFTTAGNRDAFPSAEAYLWRGGRASTLFQRPERTPLHLFPFMANDRWPR